MVTTGTSIFILFYLFLFSTLLRPRSYLLGKKKKEEIFKLLKNFFSLCFVFYQKKKNITILFVVAGHILKFK